MNLDIDNCPLCNTKLYSLNDKYTYCVGCYKFDLELRNEKFLQLDYTIGDYFIRINNDITIIYKEKHKGWYDHNDVIIKLLYCIMPKSFEKQDLQNLLDRLLNLGVYS